MYSDYNENNTNVSILKKNIYMIYRVSHRDSHRAEIPVLIEIIKFSVNSAKTALIRATSLIGTYI